MVTNYGNPMSLIYLPREFLAEVFMSGSIAFVAQPFFAWRLWKIAGVPAAGKKYTPTILPIAICCLSAAQFGVILWGIYVWSQTVYLQDINDFFPRAYFWVGFAALADILISCGMIYYLVVVPGRSTTVQPHQSTFTTIATRAVETNTVTLFCQIGLIAILASGSKGGLWFLLFDKAMVRAYTFSLIASLNGRRSGQGLRVGSGSGSSLPVSVNSARPVHRGQPNEFELSNLDSARTSDAAEKHYHSHVEPVSIQLYQILTCASATIASVCFHSLLLIRNLVASTIVGSRSPAIILMLVNSAQPSWTPSKNRAIKFPAPEALSSKIEDGGGNGNNPACSNKARAGGPVPTSEAALASGRTGSSISWKKLRQDALTVAGSLVHGPLSIQPLPLSASNPSVNRGAIVSPIVLLHLPNSIQWTVLALGVLASGLTVSGVNPVLTPTEIAHIFIKAAPAVIITTPAGLVTMQAAFDLLEPVERTALAYPTRGNVFLVDTSVDDYGATESSLNEPREWISGGWKVQDWKLLLPATPLAFETPKYLEANEDDLRAAVIFWSSGTSGKSKGVILTHKALASAIVSVWYGAGLGAEERLMGLPPFYHIFGWANSFMLGPAFGATVTIVSKFDPNQYLRLVEETRATHLHIAPPVAVLFAKSPLVSGYDLSSVRDCTSGGAPVGTSIIKGVYERLGFMVKLGYGLSETGGVSGQKCQTWGELEKILGSTGTVFDGTELKIISVTDGKTVNVDEQGEVCIRSNFLFKSYLNNPEATDEALDPEGWFRTGDVGKLDAQGNLSIVDRLKEVIKVKGLVTYPHLYLTQGTHVILFRCISSFQVAPAELEDGLCSSPLVQDAGVSSIYNEDHATEYPRAYVVPFDKEVLEGGQKALDFAHELRKHIEAKYTPYKWIRGGFVIVEVVPKSPAGKILRRLLKDTKGHLVHVYEEKIRAKL
ncbi:hypothetical protein P7C70_g2558, partial [Phenoliferia sp. Uapishka_3]